MLALWSEQGSLSTWYTDEGGPLVLWRDFADDVDGRPVGGGHFFPEEYPAETAQALRQFFAAAATPSSEAIADQLSDGV